MGDFIDSTKLFYTALPNDLFVSIQERPRAKSTGKIPKAKKEKNQQKLAIQLDSDSEESFNDIVLKQKKVKKNTNKTATAKNVLDKKSNSNDSVPESFSNSDADLEDQKLGEVPFLDAYKCQLCKKSFKN